MTLDTSLLALVIGLLVLAAVLGGGLAARVLLAASRTHRHDPK